MAGGRRVDEVDEHGRCGRGQGVKASLRRSRWTRLGQKHHWCGSVAAKTTSPRLRQGVSDVNDDSYGVMKLTQIGLLAFFGRYNLPRRRYAWQSFQTVTAEVQQ